MDEYATDDDLLDITPDPKVLLALTQTPLRPLDALCELIDNGIDAFSSARNEGIPIPHRLIDVQVAGPAQIRRGEGVLRVTDNGAGLDRTGLKNTLQAGFSGKNRFDTLGLFGMGFNIATGKLGRRTVVTTARASDDAALRVVLDLPKIVNSRSFNVPVESVPKPPNFDHGTIIEIDHWWPEGDANAGFALQLASTQKANLRQQLGRRYASILRRAEDVSIRIVVNQEALEAYEHCVWSEGRFVERRGWGNVPARIDLNEVVYVQRRCIQDGSIIPADNVQCMECGSEEFRNVEERVRGWVGIQRFDDNNRFGIDLVRNGRTIRVAEKDAFFTFANELGESVKEYPTDQQTGRIVGEIHLDHVPVDFQKQDFQRTTEEWARAISYVRGQSLLPSNWTGEYQNTTPVSRLFQGYRKVRQAGAGDMYMGRWDETTNRPIRISRQVEEDYYARFLAHEPGFYDDTKWWELVEAASVPPVVGMPECPHCGFQNLPSAEICGACEAILKSKSCVECGVTIPASTLSCPICSASQVPEVIEPWRCLVCKSTNDVDSEACQLCGSLRGAEDPMSLERLVREGTAVEDYSFASRTFQMADGRQTEPLSVTGYRSAELRPVWDGKHVPTVTFRRAGDLHVFVNDSHPVFAHMGVRPQEMVAIEAAQYLHALRTDLVGNLAHSVPAIAAIVLSDVWSDELASSPDGLSDSIRDLFERIADRLTGLDESADFYAELDEFEQRELADKLISASKLGELTELVKSGAFLRYAGPSVTAKHFRLHPDAWFGHVWNETLPSELAVGGFAAATAREQRVGIYQRCLEDCAAFARFGYSDPLIVARAQASRDFLEAHIL